MSARIPFIIAIALATACLQAGYGAPLSEEAEIARLKSAPAIMINVRDSAVSSVLSRISAAVGFTYIMDGKTAAGCVTMTEHARPWNILEKLVKGGIIDLCYEGGLWHVYAPGGPVVRTYQIRRLDVASGEPEFMADIRRLVEKESVCPRRPAGAARYDAARKTLRVIAGRAVQAGVEAYLSFEERTKRVVCISVTTASSSGGAAKLGGTVGDGITVEVTPFCDGSTVTRIECTVRSVGEAGGWETRAVAASGGLLVVPAVRMRRDVVDLHLSAKALPL